MLRSLKGVLGEFSVCPVCAGMNLDLVNQINHTKGLPRVCGDEPLACIHTHQIGSSARVCGDEPYFTVETGVVGKVCPVCTGMNP